MCAPTTGDTTHIDTIFSFLPTRLLNCSQPQENWRSFFWRGGQLDMFDVCPHHGWYNTHRYDIFKLLPTRLLNCSQPQENWRKLFFWRGGQLDMFDVCPHHGWYNTHRYDILKLLPSRSTSSSVVNGRPLDLCLHRHPVSVNYLYHARMVSSVGGSFAYFARNARCTVTTDLLVCYSNKQSDFSPEAAIFSLHTLTSPSGRNVNYDEK
jgi:hypothetical protein